MIKFHYEGDEFHQGLNIYHPKDKGSIGFILRFGSKIFRIRWSKIIKRLHVNFYDNTSR